MYYEFMLATFGPNQRFGENVATWAALNLYACEHLTAESNA